MGFEKLIEKQEKKSIYKDGNTLVKVFDTSYHKADVLNEALNNARVEETGLKIPKLLEVGKIDGKWAITRQFVEGETFEEIMEKDPTKIDEYLDKFVDIQMEIHSKSAPNLNKHKDKMHAKISSSKYDATVRFELHSRLDSMKKHSKVLHGDFCPSNIIVTPKGEYYVIDWAHATQGNASADAARTYLTFSLAGKKDVAEKYLDLYCKKSDTPKQLVQEWLPIVACSESVKNIKSEQAMLDEWVNVVDWV